VKGIVRQIRAEVLEARGVNVEKMKEKAKEFISIPQAQIPKPAAPPKLKPSSHLESLEQIKKVERIPNREELLKKEEHFRVQSAVATDSKQKASMQDALYQIEEIKKLLEEK
jgi:hypothetical protein